MEARAAGKGWGRGFRLDCSGPRAVWTVVPAAAIVRRLAGWDLNFYCLDLTNTAQVRAVETPAATYLLLAQAEDREWDRVAPVFAAMTASFMAGLPSAVRGRRAPAAE